MWPLVLYHHACHLTCHVVDFVNFQNSHWSPRRVLREVLSASDGRLLQYSSTSPEVQTFTCSPKNTEGYQFSKTFFGVIFENNPKLRGKPLSGLTPKSSTNKMKNSRVVIYCAEAVSVVLIKQQLMELRNWISHLVHTKTMVSVRRH